MATAQIGHAFGGVSTPSRVSAMEDGLGEIRKPERAAYTPLDFMTWRETESLVVAPEFQRRAVWGRPAKAYLIDTLLRGLPVPPLYLRVRQSDDKTRTIREVIDGQQRISAVLDFLDGKYALTPSLDRRYAGRYFDDLEGSDQDAVRNYSFISEVFTGISDAHVLEIFARLNTYSVQLTAQELRNGRYFGFFKQSAYRLAHEHIEFWRRNKIMSDRDIARMAEAELTSELMILQIDGVQDKKNSINSFYANFDDDFPHQERVEDRFRRTIRAISETFPDGLGDTSFRRPPMFYSLFAAVHHRRYGLPKTNLPTPRTPVSDADRKSLRSAVSSLSDVLTTAAQDLPVPDRYIPFVNASSRQTDNIAPRVTRLEFVYRQAF